MVVKVAFINRELILSLTKEAKIHNREKTVFSAKKARTYHGEKTVFSAICFVKAGQLHTNQWN